MEKKLLTEHTNVSGLYTIKCKPQKGKKVRIQWSGVSRDKINTEVEVSGKKLDDGVARDDAKAQRNFKYY